MCEGVADPQHDVLWTFNNSPIASTFATAESDDYYLYTNVSHIGSYGTLTVIDVQYDDAGTYQCSLNNTVATVTSSVELTVVGELR